jgi:hypothetical protein
MQADPVQLFAQFRRDRVLFVSEIRCEGLFDINITTLLEQRGGRLVLFGTKRKAFGGRLLGARGARLPLRPDPATTASLCDRK